MAGDGEEEFSPACMEVLHAICDTLIPSLPYTHDTITTSGAKAQEKHLQIAAFFQLRGSLDGLPQEVARKMGRFLRPADVGAVKLLLWLLSTRAGTLLLARKLSLTRADVPFAKAFPALPVPNREKVLQAWSSSPGLLRTLFSVFKAFILREFYTKVDKDGQNPVVWDALDYVGPDPRLASDIASDACDDDLEMQLVHMSKDADAVLARLNELGLLSGDGTLDKDVTISADAVIIGSGSGGSVVASQLAEAGYKVVILEKGKYFSRTDLPLLEGSAADMYEGRAFLSTSDAGVFIFAGSTVGGGSAINWSASLKTPPHVLHEWSQNHGLDLFASPRYADAMERVCERLQVQENADQENLPNSALRKGCLALSMHVGNVPRNAPPDHFCGWCGFGCKSGKKQSANRAWLVDAARKGAVILTGCEARKIILRKQKQSRKPMRASGVIAEACIGKKKIAVRVDAKVVVAACGALWTPPLLRRSGLRNYHIGRNLHLHPAMVTWGYFKEVEPQGMRSYEGGIMTTYSREAANWDSSGYGALIMVPSLHPGAFAALMPWISGKASRETMLGFANTANLIAITRDSGSGCVTEDGSGHLQINYKLSKTDRLHCLVAACTSLQILAAAGATKVGTNNVEGGAFDCESGSCANFEGFLGGVRLNCLQKSNTPLASAHQMGSCRMGTSSSTSVVDPNGETWEAQGLFVADTSVFPTASGVNPMITVQSIALCTSQSILSFLQNLKRV